MSAVTRTLSSTSLRAAMIALIALAGAAPALAEQPGRGGSGGNRGGGGGYRGGGGNNHGGGGHNGGHGGGYKGGYNHGSRTSWGFSGFSGGYGSGAAFGFSTSNGYRSGTSVALGFNFPIYNPRPYYTPAYCPPTYYTPVRRVIIEPAPVIYTQPQVIYTQPQVVYSAPPTVVVQQPAQVITAPAPAPAPQITNVIMASSNPGQVAAARTYRDVTPNDLNISALRTGDTVVVMVSGSNTMEGYSTSLSINETNSADATLVLRNEPPLVTQNLRNTNFAVNASVRVAGNPSTIGVKVAGQAYQVPIVDVPSVTDSNAAR